MISKPEIIATAACPQCCALRREQCTFTRQEDPHGLRRAAMQSHLPRMQLARKIRRDRKSAIASFTLFP